MESALALQALAIIIGDDGLRQRFLALTGYDGATIRAQAASTAMAEAVAAFLSGHEPDLLQVAGRLGVAPNMLVENPS